MTTPSTVAAPKTSSLPLRPSAATDATPELASPPAEKLGPTTDGASPSSLAGSPLTTNGDSPPASSAPAVPFSLASKLAAVAGDIDRVAKKGRNREQNYTFAAAGDIFDEIRGKLAAQRVALRWSIDRENTHLDAVESKSGAKGLFATLWIMYAFIDGDSGEEFDYYTIGTANDYPGDKAVYKAQTNALKYLLTQTFLVSTGDDVENDGKPNADDGATYKPRADGQSKMSTVQQARIIRLNAELPKPRVSVAMDAMLRDLPYDKALAQLSMEHDRQCGANCSHVTGEA